MTDDEVVIGWVLFALAVWVLMRINDKDNGGFTDD